MLSSAYKEKQLRSSVYLFYPCKILVLLCLQLVEELVEKWQSYPKSQQTPICAHLLGLAMKIVTQLAMGTRFAQDAEVIRFRKNHEAVSSCFKLLFLTDIVMKDNSLFFLPRRSGQRLGKDTWTVLWRRAPAGRRTMRAVRGRVHSDWSESNVF